MMLILSIQGTDWMMILLNHNCWTTIIAMAIIMSPQGQQSTAVSKVQIKLNNLINNHKELLNLYDDIVDLFNDYVLSPYFDKYSQLKSRKSFIQSMERMYRVTHLRPTHCNVILHDGAEVAVPIFGTKSMILDLLTNPFSHGQSKYS
jgi:hypothetical protein